MNRKTRYLITRQLPTALMFACVCAGIAILFLTHQLSAACLVGGLGMAVTANQLISRKDGNRQSYKSAVSTRIYEGTLVYINSGGYADDDTASGVNTFGGISIREVDNSGGQDGDLNVECWIEGVFVLPGSGFTIADVGKAAFGSDNYTVNVAGTGVRIGKVVEFVSTTSVMVKIDVNLVESVAVDQATTEVLVFSGATGVNEIRVPTNLADALSIESSAGDIVTLNTTTGAVVVTFGAAVRVNIAGDFQGGSASTDLVAFHGATPTDQCAAYVQTYATADRTHAAPTAAVLTLADGAGSNDNTIGAITADASVIAAVQELADEINKLVADVADVKQFANAIADDLQEKGFAA